jgi:hypothetical protein
MDTLLCNDNGNIVFSESTVGTIISKEETLAFLYNGSGTETTYIWDADGVTYADVFVVGGGGGGTKAPATYVPGGGGGGGEVVHRRGVQVTPGVEIKVGRGGPMNTQGGVSQFTSLIKANGGGHGDSGSGGSGGGARRNDTTPGLSVKLSVDGMGCNGGPSITLSDPAITTVQNRVGAGGGGGASEVGDTVFNGTGSDGGEGYKTFAFGIYSDVYGSGGGGGCRSSSGSRAGGIGGTNAGTGGRWNNIPAATPGVAHKGGGGGGGGGQATAWPGASGGSGIVLVKPNPGAFYLLGSSVYTQAVGAYALRRLFPQYAGPQIRLRRSYDNAETDVYFDKYGNIENLGYSDNHNTINIWLLGATGYVKTWYDQSPGANHMTQATASLQPVLVLASDDKNHIRFQNKIMTGPNVFGSSTITDMHIIAALRENVRSSNYFLSLNGTEESSFSRFFIHAPYTNGTWYWDPGSASIDRVFGGYFLPGPKMIFSGYKSSINGFRLNGQTRYLSSGSTTATVSGGLRVGTNTTDHNLYELIIFSSKLSESVESFIEQSM